MTISGDNKEMPNLSEEVKIACENVVQFTRAIGASRSDTFTQYNERAKTTIMVTAKLLEYVFQEHEEYSYALSQPSPRWLCNGLTPANAVYSRIITERCPIVFAILLSVSRPGRIFDFVEADLEDKFLPLQPDDVPEFGNAGRIFIFNQHKWLIAASPRGSHLDLQPGEIDPYFLVASLGRGPRGQVYVGQPKISTDYPQARVCIKRLTRPLDNSTKVTFPKDLYHRHLIKFLGSYNLEGLTSIITSPVCDMNLAEFLHEKPHGWVVENMMGRAVQWMHCLSSAVKYLHNAKLYHHNLKPSNILVRGQRLFITDFCIPVGPRCPDQLSSKMYAAPELAFPAGHYAGSAADVFSLACIFADVVISSLGLTPSTLRAGEASGFGTGALFCKNLAAVEKLLNGLFEICTCPEGSDLLSLLKAMWGDRMGRIGLAEVMATLCGIKDQFHPGISFCCEVAATPPPYDG